MKKRYKIRIVKKWGKPHWDNTPLNDKHLLLIMALSMIPIIGQIYFIQVLFHSLKDREIIYEKEYLK